MPNDTPKWHRYLRFWRANVAADVDDEIAFHVDARTDELCATGCDRAAARAQALREFGNMNQTRTTLRAMDEHHAAAERRVHLATDLVRDVRVAARTLRRSPGLVAIVVLTFALGIGVTSAIYSVVDAFMFRPLPGAYGADLVMIGRTETGLPRPHDLSYPDYKDFRADTAIFASLAGYLSRAVEMETDRGTDRLWVDEGTSNYFSTLGLAPMLGRTFARGDDEGALAHPEIVLTYKGWITHFRGDSAIIGRAVRINDHPMTVIGVMPAEFHGVRPLLDIDAIAPINQMSPADGAVLDNRAAPVVNVLGRLRPGISMSTARKAVRLEARELERAYPATNKNVDAVLVAEHFARPGPEASATTPIVAAIFMTLVTLVLIVACANVASVLLARVVVRGREMAVRAAIGASPWRLVRQVLVECSLLAALGGAVSIVVAYAAIHALASIRVATELPIRWGVELDGRIVAFTGIATLLAALATAIAPAAAARRRDLNDLLKSSAGNSGSAGHRRMRSALVVAQIAVSVLVLVCAGLFAKSASKAMHMDFGFRTDHLVMLTTGAPEQGYDSLRAGVLYEDILERAAALPGVRSAALSEYLPFGFQRDNVNVFPIAPAVSVPTNGFSYFTNVVSDGYFATMGIPLLRGRTFTAHDDMKSPRVVVVNDSLAKAFWPGQSAIGKRFHAGSASGPIVEIIGVVAGMQDLIPGERPKPYVFWPLAQSYSPKMKLLVHTTPDPASLVPALRAAIRGLDATLPLYDVRTMDDHLRNGQALLLPRIGSAFASVFGLLALVLATVGVYGVVSYSVAQRTREIGVRVALGARVPAILRLVVMQGMRLAWIGVAIGIVLAVAATGALGAILYGVAPRDPVVLGSVVAIVTIIAAVASVVPAGRAVSIDPVRALRAE